MEAGRDGGLFLTFSPLLLEHGASGLAKLHFFTQVCWTTDKCDHICRWAHVISSTDKTEQARDRSSSVGSQASRYWMVTCGRLCFECWNCAKPLF